MEADGIVEGSRVLVICPDAKRAARGGRVVGRRAVGARVAWSVRHDCGRLRTWLAEELRLEAARTPCVTEGRLGSSRPPQGSAPPPRLPARRAG